MVVAENIKTAAQAAWDGGQAILEVYQRDFTVEYKDDRSPLTEADRAAHEIICAGLKSTGLPVLSEESKTVSYEQRKNWDRFWLVDPLDGTKEFIKKNGEFTVNIALIDAGRPVLGSGGERGAADSNIPRPDDGLPVQPCADDPQDTARP